MTHLGLRSHTAGLAPPGLGTPGLQSLISNLPPKHVSLSPSTRGWILGYPATINIPALFHMDWVKHLSGAHPTSDT